LFIANKKATARWLFFAWILDKEGQTVRKLDRLPARSPFDKTGKAKNHGNIVRKKTMSISALPLPVKNVFRQRLQMG
jgi:hypothetical protein